PAVHPGSGERNRPLLPLDPGDPEDGQLNFEDLFKTEDASGDEAHGRHDLSPVKKGITIRNHSAGFSSIGMCPVSGITTKRPCGSTDVPRRASGSDTI